MIHKILCWLGIHDYEIFQERILEYPKTPDIAPSILKRMPTQIQMEYFRSKGRPPYRILESEPCFKCLHCGKEMPFL